MLKARLRGGILNKARRGEYRCPLPSGSGRASVAGIAEAVTIGLVVAEYRAVIDDFADIVAVEPARRVVHVAISIGRVVAHDGQAKVTREQAEITTPAKVPRGNVQSAELEREHGQLIWSFETVQSGSLISALNDVASFFFVLSAAKSPDRHRADAVAKLGDHCRLFGKEDAACRGR